MSFSLMQAYEKALKADSAYKPAAEGLAVVLTDLGTSLKLAGNTQEGIQKYYEAIKIDQRYAASYFLSFLRKRMCPHICINIYLYHIVKRCILTG